jgi:hypothetical protein
VSDVGLSDADGTVGVDGDDEGDEGDSVADDDSVAAVADAGGSFADDGSSVHPVRAAISTAATASGARAERVRRVTTRFLGMGGSCRRVDSGSHPTIGNSQSWGLPSDRLGPQSGWAGAVPGVEVRPDPQGHEPGFASWSCREAAGLSWSIEMK